MSATEILIERAKGLTQPDAASVLGFIEWLEGRKLNAIELMRLPKDLRDEIVKEQFAGADEFYRNNPDLIIDDKEGPIGHD